MGLGRHLFVGPKAWLALILAATTHCYAVESTESSGEFVRVPVKGLSDTPGPVWLGKDFLLIAVARKDDDLARETFGLRKFSFDGKEDQNFSDAANTPPYFPSGSRRLGTYFHDLAGKIDPSAARSTRNYANRVVPSGDGGWIVAGRVGGDEGKVLPALMKVKEDGTVDAAFGKSGRVVLPGRYKTLGISAAQVLGSERDKRLWIGMPYAGGTAVARLDEKGALDGNFGDDGFTALSREGYDYMWPQSILPHQDGGATLVGCAYRRGERTTFLARVTASGKLDKDNFGERDNGGWVTLQQTRCDTWTYPPRTNRLNHAYYYAADARVARDAKDTITLAVDGQDASRDGADPILGVRDLNWKKNTAGVLRLAADGKPDASFGKNGVVVVRPLDGDTISSGPIHLESDGVLWASYVLTNRDGASVAFQRFDKTGKSIPWTKLGKSSVGKLVGDFLVFPSEAERELSIRAMHLERAQLSVFGFSAPLSSTPENPALKWKLWQITP